ncbi:MAG: adenylate/guanylate cyclase domain-containing protein, partial [Spirochaetota bacterium]
MDNSNLQEAERRQATIMFADISGFTEISGKLDPEEVTSIMNDCFDILCDIVKKNGGNIDKFIGDCIMAVFGVPTAIEDAHQKAINTAIEMRNKLYLFNTETNLKIPLDMHIGVNTGEVISGAIGSRDKKDYTVMGDAVNLASRLKDASKKGQILVGPSTYRYTRDIFEYKELSPITLKGKA